MPISPPHLASGRTAPLEIRRHRRISNGLNYPDANGSYAPTANGHTISTVNEHNGYERNELASDANGHNVPLTDGRYSRMTNGHYDDALQSPSTPPDRNLLPDNGDHINRNNVNGGGIANGRADPRSITRDLAHILSRQPQISFPRRQTSIGSVDWFISAIRAEILDNARELMIRKDQSNITIVRDYSVMIVQSTDRNCFRADVVDPTSGPVLMGSDSESVVAALRSLLAVTTRLMDEFDHLDELEHELDQSQDRSRATNDPDVGDREEKKDSEIASSPHGSLGAMDEGVRGLSRKIDRRWSC